MRLPSVRPLLLLQLVALAAVSSALLLAIGLPRLVRQELTPLVFAALIVGSALTTLVLGSILLARSVVKPVERILAAAQRLSQIPADAPELPLLGEPGGHVLSRAAVAFERVGVVLAEERARLAAKVEELTAANRSLAEARESVLRSERLATMGRLAAGLAHEVGNPLGAITGYVELARTRLPKDADPELIGALGRIESAAERIDRTVRDLLDFARPARPALSPVALAPVVETVLRLARVQPRFHDVEAQIAIPPDLPAVLADEHQLCQVLLNLFLNAGDSMEGCGRLEIAARLTVNGSTVALSITDNGPGIASEHLPRLFDPFFTTKEGGKGSGLGLAISQRIVESFGGSMEARSEASRGAVFTILLPRAPAGAA